MQCQLQSQWLWRGNVSLIVSRERGFALELGKLRGGQYRVRTKLPSSWKGCGIQEGVGEREQVTLREETVLFREGKGNLMGEQLE